MSGMDELLDEQSAAPAAEPTPAPAPEAAPEAPSSEVTAQPEAQAPVTQQPAAPHESQDPMAPVRALLDEREKRRAAEARANQLEAWRADQERRRREVTEQAPNLLEDPEGYHAYWENRHRALEQGFQQKLQHTITRERIESSTEKWTDKLGEEEFNKLRAWSATMPPQWVKHAESQRDPFGFAKREFDKQQEAKRAQELTGKLGGRDFDAYVEELVAQRLAQTQQQPAAASQPRNETGQFAPKPPTQQRHRPDSLANISAAAVAASSAPASALDGLIGD